MNDKNNGTEGQTPNPTFSVMPKVGGPMAQPSVPTPKPKNVETKPAEQSIEGATAKSTEETDESTSSRKWLYWLVGIVFLLGLGGLAYYLLGNGSANSTNSSASKLPKVFLQQHFGVDVCLDDLVCGDSADPDKDGLSNYNEFVEQTDPKTADTDGDGLADGDELNVFLTNPTLKYTDPRPTSAENNYTDGSQISNQYDPLTPGLKMSESRINAIEAAKSQFGLHEPSITTLGTLGASITNPASQTVTIFITNGRFDPNVITIRVNDSVVWLNKDSIPRQISSDVHPDHKNLPDLASGILGVSQTYSYKFTQTGSFTYHEESNPGSSAKIIVTE